MARTLHRKTARLLVLISIGAATLICGCAFLFLVTDFVAWRVKHPVPSEANVLRSFPELRPSTGGSYSGIWSEMDHGGWLFAYEFSPSDDSFEPYIDKLVANGWAVVASSPQTATLNRRLTTPRGNQVLEKLMVAEAGDSLIIAVSVMDSHEEPTKSLEKDLWKRWNDVVDEKRATIAARRN